ncbi:FCD domain-containing protein [candidate division KSB3 bacterium]|uniref:FCD domain-containing protein n=1 Tax=candidate division KSB3 bacterium TaxID=2044937 RepID=A0A9D5JS69_9BACT|nr:FCD domain-containing protein [candidate division KSB3 bacterium]MBD3323213.1 FCD domain-containing protein [candidate division KSB3 bacterium]
MEKLGAKHQNLDQKVYNTLKALIIERKIEPGTKILQDKLAHELGVSRTPVVNALKMLEREKLIVSKPRRGFYVRLFSREEMVHIFELREVLEGLAARRTAMDISDTQIRTLQHFFKQLTVSDKAEDVNRYAEEDRKFHNFLIEIGGKEFLSSILQTYNIITFSYQLDRQAGLVRPPKETIQEHLAIIEAICRRDPIQAEALVRRHLSKSAAELIKSMAPELPTHEQQNQPEDLAAVP